MTSPIPLPSVATLVAFLAGVVLGGVVGGHAVGMLLIKSWNMTLMRGGQVLMKEIEMLRRENGEMRRRLAEYEVSP